jgi:NADPH:quinone reductase-like Zn-dependent oxidoreductase
MEAPDPGPHEVRIKVQAIGINRAESMWRNDKYVESPIFLAGLGYEAAGIVDAVGKDIAGFAVGDAVSTIPAYSLNKYSTYGEVILAPDHAVVKHPETLSFVEAASVWMMFLTAYGALVFDAQVKAGDFVIITAASSSVGLAAIQIANYAGATPIALTRTSEKKRRLHEAGAEHVVATQEQDMVAEVMRITDGNGARVVFDPVGGPDFAKLIAALAFHGVAYIYGALSEDGTSLPVLEMIRKMPVVKVASEIAPAAWFLRVTTATIPVLFRVSVMRCSVCGSAAVRERPERTAQGYRRFRCRCGKQFNERSTGLLNRTQYPSDVIALVVLWRLRYKLSLRDLAEMFLIRGFVFSYEAVRDWEAKLTPALADELRRRRRGKVGPSWYVDETYIRVHGRWKYLYRAIDRDGALVDVMLNEDRNLAATKAFLRSAKTVTG